MQFWETGISNDWVRSAQNLVNQHFRSNGERGFTPTSWETIGSLYLLREIESFLCFRGIGIGYWKIAYAPVDCPHTHTRKTSTNKLQKLMKNRNKIWKEEETNSGRKHVGVGENVRHSEKFYLLCWRHIMVILTFL